MVKTTAVKFNKKGVKGWVGKIQPHHQLPLFSISTGTVRHSKQAALEDAKRVAMRWRQ